MNSLVGERAMGAYMRASPFPYTACTPEKCGPSFRRADRHAPVSGLDLNTSSAEAVKEERSDATAGDALLRDGSEARKKREGGELEARATRLASE